MTSAVVIRDDDTPASARTRAPLWVRWLVIALVVGVVAVLIVLSERWRTGLHEFRPEGNTQFGPIPVGATGYIGEEAWRESGGVLRVRLTSVSPVITQNTADAKVTVLRCDVAAARNVASIGFVYNARRYCSVLAPVQAGEIELSPNTSDLVVAITPRRPGLARISGIDVSYAVGLRRGHQLTGTAIHTHTA